jgi:hypothetical protein
MNTEPEQTHEEDGEGYCYHCGYYHRDESHGDWPAPGCDDYELEESEA